MANFRRVLVANRGEIAVRIIRTCRSMGIETVAVYSDFDRHALHARLADEAVHIGASTPSESYLNSSAILQAARRSGADAIHPGYGFLSENANFAAQCEQAGVAFIGPRSEVIRSLGLKEEGRKLAQAAGVPVVPTPRENEFPVLIKASAGGGGRGMRIVRTPGELREALEAGRSEAERAFGDGTLLMERYVEGARHVEIQIFGDHHGNIVHLFERDCSIQRRHQKIIEESPSPALTPELRRRMGEAAVALARSIGYTNAGTIEFLLAPTGEFYFIEVNTRIQVEHPVTEMVTGFDLVRLQIEVAQGKELPEELSRGAVRQSGHAMEVRLYAEEPANNFLPATGTLHVWQPPSGMDGLRVDSGVEQGNEIGVYYDPMLAKVIVHATDRENAIRKLAYALKQFAVQGVETNREFLIAVLEHPEFREWRAHTGFQIPASAEEGNNEDSRREDDTLFANVVAAYIEQTEHRHRAVLPSIPPRYRNNPYRSGTVRLEIGGREFLGHTHNPGMRLHVLPSGEEMVELELDGVCRRFHIHRHGEEYYVRSSFAQRKVTRLPRYPRREGAGDHETANAPMPGKVLRIVVSTGQKVKPGDPLIVLEAMKMEQTIKTTIEGVVGTILVKPGDIVAPGQMLVEIDATEDANEHASSSTSGSN